MPSIVGGMLWRYPDKPIEITPEEVGRLSEANWVAQPKFDGWNTVIAVENGVKCFSRMNEPLERVAAAHFDSSITKQISTLDIPNGSVFGAEFVGPRGSHKPALYLFDCYAYSGEWLTIVPYEDRWQRCCLPLMDKLQHVPQIHLAQTIESGFLPFFHQLKREWENGGGGLSLTEGIVLKKRSGTLLLDIKSSQKNRSQYKLKFRDCRERRW